MNTIAHGIVGCLVLVLVGCGGHHTSRQFIVLVDTSGSIEPGARADAVKSVGELAKRMHRGDRIVVIPITSDAEIDTQGTVIRLAVPSTREAYDQDLKRFNDGVHDALQDLTANVVSDPGHDTDILGTLELARQEMAADKSVNGTIIVLSDFIQESSVVNFKTDHALADETSARNLAHRLAKERHFSMQGQKAFLGSLRSTELANLPEARRSAIRAFWDEYFRDAGTETQYATDGPGFLGEFIRDRDASKDR